MRFLLSLLALLVAAGPVSRVYNARSRPAQPSASATDAVRLRYYSARVHTDPSDVAAYIELGRLKERNGYYMAALDQLHIARALGAPDGQTARLIGRCELRLGRTEVGQSELEKAVRAQPDGVDAALDIAAAYFEVGRNKDARQTLNFYLLHHSQLLRSPSPQQREPVEKLMNAFTQVGDTRTGTLLAEQVVRLAPGEPDGYAVIGRNLLDLDRPEKAIEPLKQAAVLAPENASVHYLYGLALARIPGKRSEALAEWQKSVEKEDHSLAFGEIGHEYSLQKDWRRAAVAYLRQAQIEKENPRPYQLASEMCSRAHQTEWAELCRAKAALLQGSYPVALAGYRRLAGHADPVWRQRGIDGCIDAYRQMPQRKQEYLNFVLKAAFPQPSDQAIRVADAYGEVHEFDKRKEYLHRSLQLDPSLDGHVHHELGKIAENAGLRDEAEREYQQAVAAQPKEKEYHRSLSKIYLDRRDMGDRLRLAVREAEEVVKLSAGEARDYHRLGVAYTASKDYPGAVTALQHAIDLQPGYGPAYLDLAQLSQRMGNRERSTELFQLYRNFQTFDLQKQTLLTRARANRKDASAQAGLADFYVRARDFAQAAAYYERAVRLSPANGLYREELARTYSLLGRTDDQQRLRQMRTSPSQRRP